MFDTKEESFIAESLLKIYLGDTEEDLASAVKTRLATYQRYMSY